MGGGTQRSKKPNASSLFPLSLNLSDSQLSHLGGSLEALDGLSELLPQRGELGRACLGLFKWRWRRRRSSEKSSGRVFCCVAVFSSLKKKKKILTENQRRDAGDNSQLRQSQTKDTTADDILWVVVYTVGERKRERLLLELRKGTKNSDGGMRS